jgi:hypothetical protein
MDPVVIVIPDAEDAELEPGNCEDVMADPEADDEVAAKVCVCVAVNVIMVVCVVVVPATAVVVVTVKGRRLVMIVVEGPDTDVVTGAVVVTDTVDVLKRMTVPVSVIVEPAETTVEVTVTGALVVVRVT